LRGVMNNIDKEIISILKEIFRSKKNEYVDPDELLKETIVKWSIYLALVLVIVLFPSKFLGGVLATEGNALISTLFTVAFTLLFVHLNNKSKNPSLIMYGLTWFSLMCTFYFAS